MRNHSAGLNREIGQGVRWAAEDIERYVSGDAKSTLLHRVSLGDAGQVSRPQEGLIVIAYHVEASRDGDAYQADCTSTYRRLEHEVWRVIQHQQTPPLSTAGTVETAGQ